MRTRVAFCFSIAIIITAVVFIVRVAVSVFSQFFEIMSKNMKSSYLDVN